MKNQTFLRILRPFSVIVLDRWLSFFILLSGFFVTSAGFAISSTSTILSFSGPKEALSADEVISWPESDVPKESALSVLKDLKSSSTPEEKLSAIERLKPLHVPARFEYSLPTIDIVQALLSGNNWDSTVEAAIAAKIVDLIARGPNENVRYSLLVALNDVAGPSRASKNNTEWHWSRYIQIIEKVPSDRTQLESLVYIYRSSNDESIRERAFEKIFQILYVYRIRHLGQIQPHMVLEKTIKEIIEIEGNRDSLGLSRMTEGHYLKLFLIFNRWFESNSLTLQDKVDALKILVTLAKDNKVPEVPRLKFENLAKTLAESNPYYEHSARSFGLYEAEEKKEWDAKVVSFSKGKLIYKCLPFYLQ